MSLIFDVFSIIIYASDIHKTLETHAAKDGKRALTYPRTLLPCAVQEARTKAFMMSKEKSESSPG